MLEGQPRVAPEAPRSPRRRDARRRSLQGQPGVLLYILVYITHTTDIIGLIQGLPLCEAPMQIQRGQPRWPRAALLPSAIALCLQTYPKIWPISIYNTLIYLSYTWQQIPTLVENDLLISKILPFDTFRKWYMYFLKTATYRKWNMYFLKTATHIIRFFKKPHQS